MFTIKKIEWCEFLLDAMGFNHGVNIFKAEFSSDMVGYVGIGQTENEAIEELCKSMFEHVNR